MRRAVVITVAWAFIVTGCVSGANSLCSAYGIGSDGVVYEDALAIGLYEGWDANDDGILNRNEFTTGIDDYDAFSGWGEYFDAWNDDTDGVLSEQEFTAGFMEVGVFGGWDTDDNGLLDESECEAIGG